MTIELATDWFQHMLWTAVLVCGPVMATGVSVGFGVAILQAATQVNDSAVSFAPKAGAILAVLVVSGPWMLSQLVQFTAAVFGAIASLHP